MKRFIYSYFDEQNDDFANNGIDTKEIPADFEYLPKNVFYRFFKPIVYTAFLGIFFVIVKVVMRIPFVNAKVLKKRDRKKGYFIYCNHTSFLPDAVSPALNAFPKQVYTICNPDAISIPGAGLLIKMFGAYPTPKAIRSFKRFNEGIDRLYQKGNPISVFPEAHIWPKYHKIRPFPSISFTYPVRLNAPSFCRTTVYIPNEKGFTKPKIVYDGPFYPNPDLPKKEAIEDLRNRIYDTMVKRAEEYHSAPDCRYQYIKVDSPDKVGTKIVKE